jgi:hypothetical protein
LSGAYLLGVPSPIVTGGNFSPIFSAYRKISTASKINLYINANQFNTSADAGTSLVLNGANVISTLKITTIYL